MTTNDLAGRRALVCGASRGIGRACAAALAARGAETALLARNAEALGELAETLPGGGGRRHRVVAVDMSRTDELRERVCALLDAAGPMHILVNNSGGPAAGPIREAGPETFPQALRQHLVAAHVLAQLLLPGMREAGFGRIVNVISTSVKQPIPNLGVSNTVRGAMASWAKTLAGEVAAEGITVNNVLPGPTRTERLEELIRAWAQRDGTTPEAMEASLLASVPAGRFGRPEEIAAAVAFLASPKAAYINGVSLPVDGGRTSCL